MSSFFDTYFYSPKYKNLYSDDALIAAMLKVETAFAKTQAELGIIPTEAAASIASIDKIDQFDFEKIKLGTAKGGNIAIPFVQQLTEIVKEKSQDAAKYVHFGATSQDIVDSAIILIIKDIIEALSQDSDELISLLIPLAYKYKSSPMIGRTLMQQARPLSFGYKVAVWMSGILDSKRALNRLKRNNLNLQLGGAVGTLSNMPDLGLKIQELTANYLGLNAPDITWHTQRNSFAEISASFGILTQSLAKIANDVCLMMQTEIAEVYEGAEAGKGGSSSMPHKRNPVTSTAILANSYRVGGLVNTMISSMSQSHERDPGKWHAEWETLENLAQLTGGALQQSIHLVRNLMVDELKMLANLECTQGLIYAENVSLFLSKSLGKSEAHKLVENACKVAIESNTHLKSVILDQNLGITASEIKDLFDPNQSLGNAVAFTQNLIYKAQRKLKYLDIDNQKIYYKIEGKAGLPFLILSNSLGSEMGMWDEVVPYLLSSFQILRYDNRGHGKSIFNKTNETLSIARLAQDVIELMDKLGIQEAVFCGLSMGGLIGQYLGIHHADRIKKVILCNTGAKIGDDDRWNGRIKTITENGMQAIVEDTMTRWFREEFINSNPTKIEDYRQMFLRSQVDGYSACCEAIRDADFRTENSKNAIPTLVIAGLEDPVTTLENGKFIANTVQNGHILELNAKHLSAAEQPLDFAFGILKFIQND